MSKDDRSSTAEIIQLRTDVKARLQLRVLEALELVLEEEVAEVLGVQRHERSQTRRGYRNGSTQRTVTTAHGTQTITVPRARVDRGDGTAGEFESELLPRYRRRTTEVDEAILGAYLAGANTRRIKKALAPLLGEKHLSKSAISRVAGRLKELFAQWRGRDLSGEHHRIVYLDGFHLKIRLARKVVSAPVLVALGVTEDGTKQVIALELVVRESGDTWSPFVGSLIDRGLAAPALLVTDGHAGLKKARAIWSEVKVQRCTQHKWENLKKACPKHAHGELSRDWNAVITAATKSDATKAYQAMLRKWERHCRPVARSLEEAGYDLLTFYDLPKALWRSIRTTNAIENLNREFRRRTKTQGSFSTEDAALTLLFGLIAFGQIKMRRINGHYALVNLTTNHIPAARAA